MLASIMLIQTLNTVLAGKISPAPWPESSRPDPPYVTYQKIGTLEALQTLDEYVGAERIRMQINVYDKMQLNAEILSHDVKRLLCQQQLCACEYVSATTDFDADTGLYAEILDFYIWQSQC